MIAAEQPVAMQLALQPGTPASAVLHDWTTATFHLPTEAVKTTAFETGTFDTGTFEPQNLPVTWVTRRRPGGTNTHGRLVIRHGRLPRAVHDHCR